MSGLLRIMLIISAIMLLVFVLKKIRQSKVKIEYTIFWIAFAVVLVLMGVFPTLFYWISGLIGFQAPINMIFLVIIFVLIIKVFFMTIQISQLENKIDNMVQRIAVQEKMKTDRKHEQRKIQGDKE